MSNSESVHSETAQVTQLSDTDVPETTSALPSCSSTSSLSSCSSSSSSLGSKYTQEQLSTLARLRQEYTNAEQEYNNYRLEKKKLRKAMKTSNNLQTNEYLELSKEAQQMDILNKAKCQSMLDARRSLERYTRDLLSQSDQ